MTGAAANDRVRKGYVDTPLGQIHYRSLGSGAPVVLLHQTPWSGVQYRNVMPLLAAAGFRAIALDTPGYGLSDGFDRPPTIDDYAAILPAAFDGLGLTQGAVVGHHTGASIGAAFAARHPTRVTRLILHGVPLYTPEERAERLARPHFDPTPQSDGSHLQRRWNLMRQMSPNASLAAAQKSLEHFFTTGPTEWHGHHAAFHHDIAPDLSNLRLPTLVMSNAGDTLHAILPRIRALRPDFHFAEMPGGSYQVIFDEPEAWTKIVAAFLADNG